MKAVILEDVKGMSRHIHSFLDEKQIEFVVVDGVAIDVSDFMNSETVFLHFTNHVCQAWSKCDTFTKDKQEQIPIVHIHSGDGCQKHLKPRRLGTRNLNYLGSMDELVEEMRLSVDELRAAPESKSDIPSCLAFENQFTSGSNFSVGKKLCSWLHENLQLDSVFFIDIDDWSKFKESENIAYLERREVDKSKLKFDSHKLVSKQENSDLCDDLDSFLEGVMPESDRQKIFKLQMNSETLGFLILRSNTKIVIPEPQLFAYILERFPKILLEKKHFQRILDESYQDDVTSLYNQKYLTVITNNLIEECKETGDEFSVLFIDIDHFKKVNDSMGHMVGSSILNELGKILKESIRDNDYPFRYGGDEFLLLLSKTSSNTAEKIAERIRAQVEAHCFEIGEQSVQITLSIGIASFPEHATTKEDVIEMADQAMYYGKNKSRNIVFVAS